MSTRELTCIGCPLGCTITVTMDGSTVTAVTGNTWDCLGTLIAWKKGHIHFRSLKAPSTVV